MSEARLNCQGLARRRKDLMSCILPDEGKTVVSNDLGSGEPTVTSHFSQDEKYRYACFDGVGKAPYYDRDNVLMIDDIYVMAMSQSPVGKDTLFEAFNEKYRGLSFAEQWLVDPEVIKEVLNEARQLHKMLALALAYGMGPKKMVKQAYEKGHVITLAQAKEFYKRYWDLFKGVRALARKLQRKVEKNGWIVNPFGYRLTPEPHKSFNAYIQSTVSGIMHLYGHYLYEQAPYAEFITCIHDEFLSEVPDGKVDLFREDVQKAADKLNDKLKWSVDIRVGFAAGKDWYEAK